MVRARLGSSRLLTSTFVLVHVAAAATVTPLDTALAVKLVLLATVAASLARILRLHALLYAAGSIVEIQIDDRESAAVRFRTGEWHRAKIVETSCVTPSLTVLDLQIEGRRRAVHVLLVPDNVRADDFRRVRVLMRWARPHGGAEADAFE